jgi:hypothetical protein
LAITLTILDCTPHIWGMDQDLIERLRGLDPEKLSVALDKMLEDRPSERAALLKHFRTIAPELYFAWLNYAASTGSRA